MIQKYSSIASAGGRAPAGGTIGVNGFFYKGGQFLPLGMSEPGKFKINKKIVNTNKKYEVEPYKWEYPPTPFSEPIKPYITTFIDWNVYRKTKTFVKINENEYSQVYEKYTYAGKIPMGSKFGVERYYTLDELITLLNQGARWIDFSDAMKEKGIEAVEMK